VEGRVNPAYRRVAPRDMFNEAVLLKCLGKLIVRILAREVTGLRFYDSGAPFQVGLHDAGYLVLASGSFVFRGRDILWLGTPYNAKAPWPLVCHHGGADIPVFEDDGAFTDAFVAFANAAETTIEVE
jgi:hypothetical protein